jgi:hypothetical protein
MGQGDNAAIACPSADKRKLYRFRFKLAAFIWPGTRNTQRQVPWSSKSGELQNSRNVKNLLSIRNTVILLKVKYLTHLKMAM